MQCFHTLYIRGPDYEGPVACGKCFACQSNKRKSWFMRIKYEMLDSVNSYTVTLTYDNEHLPKVVPFFDFDPLLEPFKKPWFYHPFDYRDVQLFFKRLRKEGLKFRYFGVGEYGAKTARPHYHIIFFFDYPISRIRFQTAVVKQWDKGREIVVDETDDDCIGYTLKYCMKFYNVKQPSPKIFCSKRPFIGHSYFKETTINYLRSNPTVIVNTQVGKLRLPRLFVDKIFDDDMKEYIKENLNDLISDMNHQDFVDSNRLGITIQEFRNRKRELFTERCIRAIKKKKL